MILDSLKELFLRDLKRLKDEVTSYENEEILWVVEPEILNSGGNLCLHLVGNLNAFIGVGLSNTDYKRNREKEFSQTGVPVGELVKMIDETIEIVIQGLNNVRAADLNQDFPIRIWEHPTEMAYTLMHLHSHLNYHLGQINYHRRLLDKTGNKAIQEVT